MKETIDEIIKYWSQLTVLIGITIGGLGFLLRLYFNWNIKKKEITFSVIRETKIKELKNFYQSYNELVRNLRSLQFATAQGRTENASELRNQMPEIWNHFYLSFTFLRIFLKNEEIKPFEELEKELNNVQLKLDYYKMDYDAGDYDAELIKELRHIRDEVFPKKIPNLLQAIEMNLKKDFNIK
jgi:hypothetical protein